MAGHKLPLVLLDGNFAVSRLEPGSTIPASVMEGNFFSITQTADEISIVCPQDAVPEGFVCERGWRCLRVVGTMPFSAVGVLASLTAPLAEARISVLAISTFDTDYLLVKERHLAEALEALQRHGHAVP